MITEDFTRSYLDQLYTMTDGNMEKQASMYEVGQAIGLERADAGSLAEDLMMQGLLELKTLAGGIALTDEGLKLLGVSRPSGGTVGADKPKLGNGPVLTADDRGIVENLLAEVRKSATGSSADFAHVEELVIDLKTIEVQLLSPNPKTAIIREILKSCAQSLAKIDNGHGAAQSFKAAAE